MWLPRRLPRMRSSTRCVAVLATVVVVLSACSVGGAATPRPIRTPNVTAGPATVEPAVTPAPSIPATCPPGQDFSEATLDIPTIEGIEPIELRVDASPGEPDPTDAGEPVDPSDSQVTGTVLGGRDIELALDVDTPIPGDRGSISNLAAELLAFGSATPLAVDVTFDGATATIRLPDLETRGTLRISASWTTSCGAGEGSGSIRLAVLPSSVASGCVDTDVTAEVIAALEEESIQLDSMRVPLVIVSWSERWLDSQFVDEIPQFAGWDRDATLEVAPDQSIVLRESVDDLRLVSVRVVVYDRANVIEFLDPDSTVEAETVDVIRRNAGPLGRAGIPAPIDPGRYVFEVQAVWQTSCLNLESYAVIGVDVG